jgi:hypothetical protein
MATVILSDYTQYNRVGDKDVLTKVQHTERNGHRTVEKMVIGFTYNANGTLNKPTEDPGQVLDVMI